MLACGFTVQNSLGEREEDGDPNLTPRTEAEKHNTDIKDLLQVSRDILIVRF